MQADQVIDVTEDLSVANARYHSGYLDNATTAWAADAAAATMSSRDNEKIYISTGLFGRQQA